MLPEIWGSFLNEISQLSSIFKGASETFIRRLSGVSLIKRVNHAVADSLSEKNKEICAALQNKTYSQSLAASSPSRKRPSQPLRRVNPAQGSTCS